MKGVTEGRIVHYVLPDRVSDSQHRAAVIVRNWGNGVVNLSVFTDHNNDFPDGEDGHEGLLRVTSINHDPDKSVGTWHFIEPA